MDFVTLLQILDSSVRLATPLLFACLAGLFSERAGIFDIGLEGKMLAAAFFSAAVAALTANVWIGLLAGIGASMALSIIHGLASITFRGNQLISGVAINFLAHMPWCRGKTTHAQEANAHGTIFSFETPIIKDGTLECSTFFICSMYQLISSSSMKLATLALDIYRNVF